MYRRLPQWNINYESNPGVNSFIGTAKLLREAQIPYSVLVFGHPDLWDDSKQLERLSEHDAVILPGMQCLSDAQHSALEEYLADDGFLVASGSPPSRTSRYESRNDVNQLFDDENAVILEDNPALSREENGTVGGQLQDALADAGIVPVAESQDSTLSVNIRNQPEDDRTVVHLLNYDYSKQDDQFESKSNIKISAQSPDHSVSVARYYSDQQTTELEFESVDGEIEFTVPHLTDWGFVVLAPSESALIDTHVKSDAEEKVASLRNQIENTRQSGHDWSPTFTVAETHLEEATTALDAEAYTEALSAAEKGVSAASELTRQQPIVGIDLSHGQEFESANPFEDLKAEISYPDYRMIDSWSNDLIDELDILVIPPALTWRGNEHNFQQEEIDTITEFVEDGGSLVILARGGVAPDMEMLTSEFGYAFDGRGLQFPGGSSPAAPVVTDHELTQAVSKIYAQWAATITELPENATPLASLPEDNNATFDSDEEGDESGGGVPSEPIYAVSEHGDGTVAVLGSWGYIHSPSHLYNWTPLMHNLFSTLSERAVETDDVMTETITSTSTPPSETATSTEKATETVSNQETSTESPGFGVLTGLAGVTGAALFGKWRNSDKD
jgi:PGF-CTERM protein